jgi:hypothetical protein
VSVVCIIKHRVLGTEVNKKIAVFWVVAPCSLVEVYQRFIISDDGGSKDL